MGEGLSLYQVWERVRGEAGANRLALMDLRSGRRWTFGEVQAEVEARPRLESAPRFPDGFSVELIFETLRAWRDVAVLCPVDGGGAAPAPAPAPNMFGELPAGVVHVKFTSGSTGEPRLVLFDAEALIADARKIVSTMGLRPDWPNLGVVSMAHSYGFSSLVLPLLLHGIPLAWLGDPLPGAVGAALAESIFEGAGWTLPAVPAMWRAWLEGGAFAKGEDRLKLAISAGAPLPLELERDIHAATGIKVHNFYGSSECGGIAYDRSDTPRSNGDVAGTPMDETTLSVNGEGCLEVGSVSVALGYGPGDESGRLGGGVFVTSDLATLGDDGEVRLGGRSDDLINAAGRKISPARIESVLARVRGVRNVLVFGVPSADPTRGDEIVAAVRLCDGKEDSMEAVRRSIAGELAAHECPRHWWSCPELAPDARGKLSRDRWRQRFLEQATG